LSKIKLSAANYFLFCAQNNSNAVSERSKVQKEGLLVTSCSVYPTKLCRNQSSH